MNNVEELREKVAQLIDPVAFQTWGFEGNEESFADGNVDSLKASKVRRQQEATSKAVAVINTIEAHPHDVRPGFRVASNG